MQIARKKAWYALAFLGLLLLIWLQYSNFETAKFNKDLPTVARDLAISLATISAFLERAMEVINQTWFEEQRAATQAQISWVKFELKRSSETKEHEQQLSDRYHQAVVGIWSLASSEARVRMIGSYIAGTAISVAGVRTLGTLMTNPTGTQLTAFNVVDILLTAGLLAGGSQGMHSVAVAIGNVLQGAGKTEF